MSGWWWAGPGNMGLLTTHQTDWSIEHSMYTGQENKTMNDLNITVSKWFFCPNTCAELIFLPEESYLICASRFIIQACKYYQKGEVGGSGFLLADLVTLNWLSLFWKIKLPRTAAVATSGAFLVLSQIRVTPLSYQTKINMRSEAVCCDINITQSCLAELGDFNTGSDTILGRWGRWY